MAKVYITKKVFVNKKTKQLSVSLPKRRLKRMDPTIQFDKDLFVRLEILRRKRG